MRVYFDKQIFSHLFKNEKENFIRLNDLIKNNANNFIFCYSHAHLLDLLNDKTHIKYDELKFMKEIVSDNYLEFDQKSNKMECFLVEPLKAFEDCEENNLDDISVDSLFNLDLSLFDNDPLKKSQLESSINFLDTLKIDFDKLIDYDKIPEEQREYLKKFVPTGNMNIKELLNFSLNTFNSFKNDRSFYKSLRNNTDKYLNNGKFVINENDINFNDDFKNSPLQKSFLEFVEYNFELRNQKEYNQYDFYTSAYFLLDITGISKESSKSVKFDNVINDGIHSFYGAFCDIVVSDDNGFLKKTKALYKLLGIETNVLHIEEFISNFNFTINNDEGNLKNFLSLLKNDIRNGLVIDTKKSIKYNRTTTYIKPAHTYLNYFNRIDEFVEDDSSFVVLRKSIKNYSNIHFIREIERLVNKCFYYFNIDSNNRGEFNWNIEKEEIHNDNWSGRIWKYEDFSIYLEYNKGISSFCLVFQFYNG